MANLRETAIWEAGIYQWETSDPVMGGENGIDNKPTRQLANRTLWLKTELAKAVASIGTNKTAADSAIALKADKARTISAGAGLTGGGDLSANRTITLGTPSKITASTTNSVGINTHTHEIAKASTTVAGVVKLNDTLSSQSASEALTAKQGRVLALQIDEKLGSSGTQTLSGSLKVGVANIWHKLEFPTEGGGVWIFETNPKSSLDTDGSVRLNLKYLENGTSRYISYPHLAKNETIAYQSWVSSQIETANYVALSGDQTISGTKTFSGSLKTTSEITSGAGITVSGSNKTARFGMGSSNCFIHNPASKKYLQLKDNGELAYSDDKIILQSMLSDAINSPSSSQVASSKAVKTAYDRAVAAGTARRRTHSRVISGTMTGHTNKSMNVTGETIVQADGSITQYFHIKNAVLLWFGLERDGYGRLNNGMSLGNNDRGRLIELDLWTAMPNKVLNANIQFVRSTDVSASQTWMSEASEHIYAWNPINTTTSRVSFNSRRFSGGSDEPIDIMIKVEGY